MAQDSVTGIQVFVTADLQVAGAGANALGTLARDRWNKSVSVAVSDHPADLGDGNERAVFVQDSYNSVWRLGGSRLGSFEGNATVGPHHILPQ